MSELTVFSRTDVVAAERTLRVVRHSRTPRLKRSPLLFAKNLSAKSFLRELWNKKIVIFRKIQCSLRSAFGCLGGTKAMCRILQLRSCAEAPQGRYFGCARAPLCVGRHNVRAHLAAAVSQQYSTRRLTFLQKPRERQIAGAGAKCDFTCANTVRLRIMGRAARIAARDGAGKRRRGFCAALFT